MLLRHSQGHHLGGGAGLHANSPNRRGSTLLLCYPNAFSWTSRVPPGHRSPCAAQLPSKQPPQREKVQAEYSETLLLEYFNCFEDTRRHLQKNSNHTGQCRTAAASRASKERPPRVLPLFHLWAPAKTTPSIRTLWRLSDTSSSVTI